MKTTWRIFEALVLASALASAQPSVSAVLNAASYSAVVAPGSWVAIFGTNLASASQGAPAVPLPTALGGVSVSVAGLTAPLLYVSPSQINALIPFETTIPANTVVPVVVTAPGGSVTYNIRLARDAPAIFTRNGAGTGLAFVFSPNFQAVDTIAPQDVAVLYAAGLGPTDSSGRVVDEVEVYIGERKAPVLFAGLAPGLPGIYQLNVMAPAPATDRLYLRSGGWQSNIVDIGIRSGANTANVSGAVDGLYPSSDPFFSLPPCVDDQEGPCGTAETSSVMLHAGSFSVSFDIVPSAVAFTVAAVGESGGSIISIDPAARAYTASVTTITPAVSHGDYSGTNLQVFDYGACNDAVCQPFPGMVIPLSRIDPFWARATQQLPTPNTTVPASPNALLQASGNISGSRFVVDTQTNSSLSNFGGIVQVQFGPFDKRVSTFRLYVDGKLVASKDFQYGLVHR